MNKGLKPIEVNTEIKHIHVGISTQKSIMVRVEDENAPDGFYYRKEMVDREEPCLEVHFRGIVDVPLLANGVYISNGNNLFVAINENEITNKNPFMKNFIVPSRLALISKI
jgi:hypothetical protein